MIRILVTLIFAGCAMTFALTTIICALRIAAG